MKKKFFSLLLVSLFVISMSASVFAIGGDDPHVVKPDRKSVV